MHFQILQELTTKYNFNFDFSLKKEKINFYVNV